MMYERPPPTTRFQNPPRNTTLMFQQHQGEYLYDAWTRFKNLIQRVPHHGLILWSLAQFFYDHVDQYTQMDLDFAADGNLRELDAYDEPIGDIEDKMKSISPQSTAQVLSSFEIYTSPMTYLKEVDETIGIPMKVEPLDHMKLEDLGLNA
uniref:Zinc finger, CCHC-type n=1 Tax=Tanacetum cinerariifolium TaxID=118510 RepID=A0A699GUL5_TANCI|nr:zinc finger, CCHC-type [Tanacetum cinerariifolium]